MSFVTQNINLQDNVDYNTNKITATEPGSITYVKLIQQHGGNAEISPTYNVSYTVPEDSILIGCKSFISVDAKITLSDGSDVPNTNSNVFLSQECDSVMIRGITYTLNGTPVSGGDPDYAYLIRHNYDRYFDSTDGQRTAFAKSYRRVEADGQFSVRGGSTYFKNSVIHDGATVRLTRPLDDLPFFGKDDVGIPPLSILSFRVSIIQDLQRLFENNSSITNPTQFRIENITINLAQQRISPQMATSLITRIASQEGLRMTSTFHRIQQIENIAQAKLSYLSNDNLIFKITPNLVQFELFGESTFQPSANRHRENSILSRTWGNVESFSVYMNGRCVREVENISSGPGRVELLHELNNFFKEGVVSSNVFANGVLACFPIALDYDKTEPHVKITNQKMRIRFNFTTNGSPSQLFLFMYSVTNESYILRNSGLTEDLGIELITRQTQDNFEVNQ